MRLDLSELAHHCQQTPLYYGDSLSLSITAASVIAKVHRDRLAGSTRSIPTTASACLELRHA